MHEISPDGQQKGLASRRLAAILAAVVPGPGHSMRLRTLGWCALLLSGIFLTGSVCLTALAAEESAVALWWMSTCLTVT